MRMGDVIGNYAHSALTHDEHHMIGHWLSRVISVNSSKESIPLSK